MRIEQTRWTQQAGWRPHAPGRNCSEADLVLVFGGSALFREAAFFGSLSAIYPHALMVGCSTAGEIFGTEVTDDSLVCTAIRFNHASCQGAMMDIHDPDDGRETGRDLARKLELQGLQHVIIFSDGLGINGSELVSGLKDVLPPSVSVTGGLAGDGDRFQETYVVWRGFPQQKKVVAIGLYGDSLVVGYGSLGGWDPFGPERIVTRSDGNVLYELDGVSALEIYRRYLGEHAAGLPATGLLFPLAIRTDEVSTDLVRTILSVSEADQSMTFAGDVPEGAYARLMKANFDRLIDGAVGAAESCRSLLHGHPTELALLISCVGRKMVLKQRVEEEVEGVRDVIGPSATLTGFYSYGEISPIHTTGTCELHNQTMTITAISECDLD